MATIIGRKQEANELLRIYNRKEANLVAVYGRRRVGKTFLVRELFKDKFAFYHTGLSPIEHKGKNLLDAQLKEFASTLQVSGFHTSNVPKSWSEAFLYLREYLTEKQGNGRMVVFIDEMPWMDTPRSGFITAFEHFWNGWASGVDELMLIVCGSASSWIKDNLIDSPGGLYDRVSCEIQLSPFTLHESEQLLALHEISHSRYDIAEIYMATGGIPFYLNYLQPGLSASQQIDLLFFNKKAKLKDEYDRLFNSTFSSPDDSRKVVEFLCTKHSGFSRDEISKKVKVEGKELTKLLRSLEAGDFITKYQPFTKSKRQVQYRLTDHFCRFWIAQVMGKNRSDNYWHTNHLSNSTHAWRGIAFEELCMLHVQQIKSALQIAGVASEESAWIIKGNDDKEGAQIDLIIKRSDNIVNLCEMKCYQDEYQVTKEEEMKIRSRMSAVMEHLKKRQSLNVTLVTNFGLKQGIHSGIFTNVITLDDLFR
mgnify:CR=1 FL=1